MARHPYPPGTRIVVSDSEHRLHGEAGTVVEIASNGIWVRFDKFDGFIRHRIAWWRLRRLDA